MVGDESNLDGDNEIFMLCTYVPAPVHYELNYIMVIFDWYKL